jgi:hypothetical protein
METSFVAAATSLHGHLYCSRRHFKELSNKELLALVHRTFSMLRLLLLLDHFLMLLQTATLYLP